MDKMGQRVEKLGQDVLVVGDGIATDIVDTGSQNFGSPCLDCEASGRQRRAGEHDHDRTRPLDKMFS